MNFINTEINGVVIVEPKVFKDSRGYFFESYNEAEFIANGITNKFIQDNQSKSVYGVVRCLQGCVLDVAVDFRPGSETFGKYVSVELSDKNKKQLFIPRGFLHGFSVLSKTAIFAYKCDNLYCKESEFSIRFDDPDINVDWRIPAEKIITSEKDKLAKRLKDVISHGR